MYAHVLCGSGCCHDYRTKGVPRVQNNTSILFPSSLNQCLATPFFVHPTFLPCHTSTPAQDPYYYNVFVEMGTSTDSCPSLSPFLCPLSPSSRCCRCRCPTPPPPFTTHVSPSLYLTYRIESILWPMLPIFFVVSSPRTPPANHQNGLVQSDNQLTPPPPGGR